MPSADFEAAARWLTSPSAPNPPNSTKLEIYGLYKFVTVAPHPKPGTRPSIFDWTGAAKWDAWDAAGKKFDSLGTSEAESRYLEIARSLGYTPAPPSAPSSITTKPPLNVAEDDGIDYENLSDSEVPVSSRKGGGMGVRVSALAPDSDEEDERSKGPDDSIHGCAVSGDVVKLKSIIETGADVNGRDEYGLTPLHLASDRGHVEVVKLLLASGAERNLKSDDEDGLTALDFAQVSGNQDIINALQS